MTAIVRTALRILLLRQIICTSRGSLPSSTHVCNYGLAGADVHNLLSRRQPVHRVPRTRGDVWNTRHFDLHYTRLTAEWRSGALASRSARTTKRRNSTIGSSGEAESVPVRVRDDERGLAPRLFL